MAASHDQEYRNDQEYRKPKKRLIVCADGTWQNLKSPYPTNVVKIAQAIKPSSNDGIPQIVFYCEGVGSGNTPEKIFAQADRILGGACGIGIDNNIEAAYRFLSLNYEPGDEIYLFGFSRGAYTVRSLAGLIHCSGGLLSLPHIRKAPFAYELYRDRTLTLKEKEAFRKLPISHAYNPDDPDVKNMKRFRAEALKIYRDRSVFKTIEAAQDAEKKETEEAEHDFKTKQEKVQQLLAKYTSLSKHKEMWQPADIWQSAKITLLACWDTVGSLGIPNCIPLISKWINKKYGFYDTQLSSIVENALHAVAIDETRKVFDVTRMKRKSGDTQPLEQAWFPGGHGCVGGGSQEERGLSDRALEWMIDQIEKKLKLGLEFNRTVVEDGIQPDCLGSISNCSTFYKLFGVIERKLDKLPVVDVSAENRWRYLSTYRPPNLEDYAKKHGWKPLRIGAHSKNLIFRLLPTSGRLNFDDLKKECPRQAEPALSSFLHTKET